MTNRRNKEYEAPDMAAMMTRIARALVRRAAEGDLEAIGALAQIGTVVNESLTAAITENRAGVNAYSWAEIGAELGMSRQAAQQRFGQQVAS